MTISLSFSVTGGEIGRQLAYDSEEAVECLATFARGADFPEFVDFLEQWARYADKTPVHGDLARMRQLRDSITEALDRAEKP